MSSVIILKKESNVNVYIPQYINFSFELASKLLELSDSSLVGSGV